MKNTKNKKPSARIGALALSLCLVLLFSFFTSGCTDGKKPPALSTGEPDRQAEQKAPAGISEGLTVYERLCVPMPEPIIYGDMYSVSLPPIANYAVRGATALVRVSEVLPDTYRFLGMWDTTEFRLVKMSTVESFGFDEPPNQFYFIVPSGYLNDKLTECDLLVSEIVQYSYEGSFIYNKTRKCAERVEYLIFGNSPSSFSFLSSNIAAFDKNGNFDVSLWQSNDVWISSTKRALEVRGDYYASLTLEKARETVSDTGYRINIQSEWSSDAAKYINDTQAGVYAPIAYGSHYYDVGGLSQYPLARLCKFAGRYPTNEMLVVYKDKCERTSVVFTEEDIASLPPLSTSLESIIKDLESGKINMPHIKDEKKAR